MLRVAAPAHASPPAHAHPSWCPRAPASGSGVLAGRSCVPGIFALRCLFGAKPCTRTNRSGSWHSRRPNISAMLPQRPGGRGRAVAAGVCGVLVAVVVVVVAMRSGDTDADPASARRGPVSLSTTAALERLQAKLLAAQQHEHAYQGLVDKVNGAQGTYARKKAAHDVERRSLSKQELLLDNIMETAKEMSHAQKAGNAQHFNRAVTQLTGGMAELKSSLAAADCPPTHGGQAALNMCLIKQQLGKAAMLKQGKANAKDLAALRSALEGTEQTGRQLDRSDLRLKQDVAKAQLQLREHAAWGGQVLKEQGDFAKLAAAYLPGGETRDLTQVWPKKPAAALSLLSNWMQRHDSWGLSSLAEIMKPSAPAHFDPTTS